MSRSNRDQAVDKLEELKDMISAERLLDYVISNYLSGSEALNAMICAEEEFFPKEEEDEELEVGMEVEVVDGSNCRNEVGDIGIITEVDDATIRVTVEGRINSGNWMFRNQVARINY